MAVVDVPADENISSAAEEADGNVMEIDTDIVDQDLDDKMSEKNYRTTNQLHLYE